MPTTPSATLTCVTGLQIPRKEEERGVWELHVYMCFELCLTHNWKAINLQRPQKYFYSNNKCTLFVGLFQMAQTRSPQRWYAVLIGSRGEVGWGGGIIFFFSLVMTSYGKGIGQPGTGAGVGLDTRASRMEVSFGVKRELCFF